MWEPPWYGTVCPVVWEDGGSDPASYPIVCLALRRTGRPIQMKVWDKDVEERILQKDNVTPAHLR